MTNLRAVSIQTSPLNGTTKTRSAVTPRSVDVALVALGVELAMTSLPSDVRFT